MHRPPTVEKTSSHPNGDPNTPKESRNTKRKQDFTPDSNEPLVKQLQQLTSFAAAAVGSSGTGSKSRSSFSHTLWVHSTEVEKGDILKEYFKRVITKVHALKVKDVLIEGLEHRWHMCTGGQPSWEDSKGKIICLNQQTIDYFVKMVPIASKSIGNITCKAWTRQEYKTPVVKYSCLIPVSCEDVTVEEVIYSALLMHNISKAGVKTCHSTFCKNDEKSRICHLKVTKELASILESLNHHLEGPICTLFFQVRPELPDGIVPVENSDEKVATPAPLNLPPQKKVVLPNEEVNVDISVNLNLLNSSYSSPGSPQAKLIHSRKWFTTWWLCHLMSVPTRTPTTRSPSQVVMGLTPPNIILMLTSC